MRTVSLSISTAACCPHPPATIPMTPTSAHRHGSRCARHTAAICLNPPLLVLMSMQYQPKFPLALCLRVRIFHRRMALQAQLQIRFPFLQCLLL